ncbi:MAG: hypothetical protein BWY75_03173 [bacterium ADurb.Bin425]|nr:MAG: hypothetical protein BWY75_03173 [bacterium ADurb.Bin425]
MGLESDGGACIVWLFVLDVVEVLVFSAIYFLFLASTKQEDKKLYGQTYN